ncbi:potassium channel family protein [Deltaproteobacteria bacterium]|nr:potassium channel family protein [Deltaproteobacteria bacterium]
MLLPVSVAVGVIVINTAIHAGAMHIILDAFKRRSWGIWNKGDHAGIYWVAGVILVMFMASILEVIVWALTYRALDIFQTGEEAFYFSGVTYTTLGYGDMTIEGSWRILSAFEAANGIIMFGWTTALVFAVVQRIYFHDKVEK